MLKRINIEPVKPKHKKKDILNLLDGNNFDSVADHIIYLREVGIYVQPRTLQNPSELIISVQEKLNKKLASRKVAVKSLKACLAKSCSGGLPNLRN